MNNDYYREAIDVLGKIRDETISYAKNNSKNLARLMYENQGAMRFGSENRIFLVLIDKNDMQNSWEMKRDFITLEKEIDRYLDSFDAKKLPELKLDFKYSGKTYSTHADVIFVVK